MMRKYMTLLAVILTMLLLTPAVAQSTDGTSEIVIAHPGPIYTMDAPVTWYGATHWLTMMMYDCLIWRAPDGTGYVPQLAESWENIEPDRWRFHLRENATFHNGEPITAETIKWNIERIQSHEDFMVHPQWEFIEDVEIVDKYTIDIITDGPHAYLEYDISYNGCEILPPNYIEEVGANEFARDPIGSGPYKLVEFTEGQRYVFEAYDDYWGGRPEIDRVIYQVIPERASQVAALLAGQVDLIINTPQSQIQELMATPGIKVVEVPTTTTQNLYTRVGLEHGAVAATYPNYVPTTKSKKIRQAISHALNRSILAEIKGAATPSLVRLAASYPEVPEEKYVGQEPADAWYDPELAKQLIEEAGYDPEADNKPILYFASPNFDTGGEQEVAQAIEVMLEEVGFDVRLNIMSNAAFTTTVSRPGNNRDLMLVGNAAGPSLLPLQYRCEWTGNSYYCFEELDEISDAILQEIDPQKRLELWEQWWESYLELAPTITLYQVNRNYAMSEDLEWSPRVDSWITPRNAELTPQ